MATVSSDDTISCTNCTLTNITDYKYSIASSTVTVMPDTKNISAINSSKIVINGFGTKVYDDCPTGTLHDIDDASILKNKNDSTKLNFSIENIYRDNALALCGKTVFEVTLIPIQAYSITCEKGNVPTSIITGNVPIDNNLYKSDTSVKVKDKGTLDCSICKFSGWLRNGDKIYYPNDSFNIHSDIVFTAQWDYLAHKVDLDPGSGTFTDGTKVIFVKYNTGWFTFDDITYVTQDESNMKGKEPQKYNFTYTKKTETTITITFKDGS